MVKVQADAGIARDVRRLIDQVERGQAFDFETTGHAFDVQEQAASFLAERLSHNTLSSEMERRIDAFARGSGTANMYLRLFISDTMPDLPDYSPCQVSVYDGIQNAGTDFSKVIQRSTIFGTVMTSVNITDLRAYFQSGHKRHLLVYLGSNRDADIKALDKMLTALPAILAAAGVDAGTIKAIIAAIQQGDMPPALLKLVHQAVTIAELKSMPATPAILAQIVIMEKQMPALATLVAATPSLAPVMARMAAALTKNSGTPAVAPPSLQTVAAIRTVIAEIRALAKAQTMSPKQRRDMAAILRDLRAGINVKTPLPQRLQGGLVRLQAFAQPLLSAMASRPAPAQSVLSQAVLRLVPRLMAALIVAAPVAAHTTVISQLRGVTSASPQTASLFRTLETRSPQAVSRLINRAPQFVHAVPAAILAGTLQVMVQPLRMAAPQAAGMPLRTPTNTSRERTGPAAAEKTPASIVRTQPADARAVSIAAESRPVQNRPQPVAAESIVRPEMQAKNISIKNADTVPGQDRARKIDSVPQPAEMQVTARDSAVISPVSVSPVNVSPVRAHGPDMAASILPPVSTKTGGAPWVSPVTESVATSGVVPASPPVSADMRGLPVAAGLSPQPAAAAEKAPAAGALQYNADGTLKDCCKGRFTTAAQPADTSTGVTLKADGGVVVRNDQGQVTANFSASEIRANEAAHAAVATALEQRRAMEGTRIDVSTQQRWDQELASMTQATSRVSFGHVCGAGCNHGGQHGSQDLRGQALHQAAPAQAVERDITVRLVAARNDDKQKPAANAPAWLKQRRIHPA